jgi:hypothetical protein
MKYSSCVSLILVSTLSLYSAPREPNRKYIEKISQARRSRGIEEKTAAILRAANSLTTKDMLITGDIVMPISGQTSGSGAGFTYFADAERGIIIITFDELYLPSVTATAHDLDTTRTVDITEQTATTVTLSITDFNAEIPTIVTFKATRS